MGMYTHLSLRGFLRDDAPEAIIRMLADRIPITDDFSDYPLRVARWQANDPHPFFRAENCVCILTECSWNGARGPGLALKGRRLTCSTEFKNYHSEIELFLDWIGPALDPNRLIGGVHYEEMV